MKILFIKNNKGIVLPVVLMTSVLVAIAGLTMTMVQQNTLIKYKYDAGTQERQKLFEEIKTHLTDQDNCNKLFKGNYATKGLELKSADLEKVPFISSTNKKVDAKTGKLVYPNFSLKNIKMIPKSGSPILTSSTDVIKNKYNLEISIDSKDLSDTQLKFAKVFGKLGTDNKAINKFDEVVLTIGNNNHCVIQSSSMDSVDLDIGSASQMACKSFGGIHSANGKCYVKQLAEDADGLLDYKKAPIKDQTTFSQALCEMEFRALQKGGYQLVKASGDRSYGWTTLCEKPRWTGCRENNSSSGSMFIQGEERNYKAWEGKAKQLKKKKGDPPTEIDKIVNQTVAKRLVRVANEARAKGLPMYKSNFEVKTGFNAAYKKDVEAVFAFGALGALAKGGNKDDYAFAAFNGGTVMAMTSLLGGPLGVVVGFVIIKALFSGCDKARLFVDSRCNEGYAEADKIDVYVQKLSFKGLKRRCKYKKASTIVTPTEIELAKNMIIPVAKPDIEDESVAEMAAYETTIKGTSDLASLYALPYKDPEDDFSSTEAPDEDADIPLPVSDAFLKQEIKLWAEYEKVGKGILEDKPKYPTDYPVKIVSASPGPDLELVGTEYHETAAAYDKRVKEFEDKVEAFHNGIKSRISSLASTVASQTIAASLVEQRDGSEIKPVIMVVVGLIKSASTGKDVVDLSDLNSAVAKFDSNVASTKTKYAMK